MSKNILIFSDGTGQAGGLMPDEARSNVYKLYRAARCGPDTDIDPSKQLTFYDPGLGSKADGAKIKFEVGRRIYNFLAQATGLGITRNIIDCYAEIVRLWEPGDRIYLFGFSRGAYTVRCVAGVLAYCGIPTVNDGAPLKRDPLTARTIATEAVRDVYQYGSSIKGDPYKPQREQRAKAFRQKYGAANGDRPNAAPYFIGVWDTVATLGAGLGLLIALGALGFAASTVLVKLVVPFLPFAPARLDWTASALVVVLLSIAAYLAASYRYRQWFRLDRFRMAFYDTKLNPDVAFARHALSIDENRKDFARVLWDEDGSERMKIVPEGPERFEQVWFAGVHSDVGGSYAENEARLSDVALKWMLGEAQSLPESILVDPSYLRLSPSPAGMQHDERKMWIANMAGWQRFLGRLLLGEERMTWAEGIRNIARDAPLHPSVIERFRLAEVLLYDVSGPYRPESLRNHEKVKHLYQ